MHLPNPEPQLNVTAQNCSVRHRIKYLQIIAAHLMFLSLFPSDFTDAVTYQCSSPPKEYS